MTFLSGALKIAVPSLTLALLAASRAFAALPALPPAAESFDAGILNVDRFGTGAQTLVFIPGLGCGTRAWSSTGCVASPGLFGGPRPGAAAATVPPLAPGRSRR